MKKLFYLITFSFLVFFVLGFIIHIVIFDAKSRTTIDASLTNTISSIKKYKTSKFSFIYDTCNISYYESYSYAGSIRYYTCDKGNTFVNIDLNKNIISYISEHAEVTLDNAIAVLGTPTHIRRYGSYVNFIYWKDKEVAFWSLSAELNPKTTSYAIAYYPFDVDLTDLEGWKGFFTYR